MIILGWTHAGGHPPNGLALFPALPIAVVCCPPSLARTPRARMQAQLSCFRAGLDLLPVAPAAMEVWRGDTGAPLADLSNALSMLSGTAQMTLSVPVTPSTSFGKAQSGKEWLKGRTAQHKERARQTAAFAGLVAACALPGTAVKERRGRDIVHYDFLIRREDDARTRAFVAAVARSHKDEVAGALSLVGPLPPYAFVPTLKQCAA